MWRSIIFLAVIVAAVDAGHKTVTHPILGVVDLHFEKGEQLLQVVMAANKFAGLANQPEFDAVFDLPDDAKGTTVYEHLLFTWFPNGNADRDGKGGGYGAPHADIAFFTISDSERKEKTSSCEKLPVLSNCNPLSTDEATKKFFELPFPEQVGQGFQNRLTFNMHAYEGRGLRWMSTTDRNVYTCTSTGANQNGQEWEDCLLQIEDGQEHGCTCGEWDRPSPIMYSFDKEVIGHSIMPAISHMNDVIEGRQSNPFLYPYPKADKNPGSGMAAKFIRVHYDAGADNVEVGFVLYPESRYWPDLRAGGAGCAVGIAFGVLTTLLTLWCCFSPSSPGAKKTVDLEAAAAKEASKEAAKSDMAAGVAAPVPAPAPSLLGGPTVQSMIPMPLLQTLPPNSQVMYSTMQPAVPTFGLQTPK